ncbi:hypothetical protein COU80_06050 [Candidatus Peregrinibacteria bacterium CG10_big_fil_rev_8_21_14_0_10_55_24]|nr:MAG: hypothetical protein COU80_06050 [Candidatus Peregrinibacteria bacterium CG10_big_fil_rev_8_21_14_0_10_55_24]
MKTYVSLLFVGLIALLPICTYASSTTPAYADEWVIKLQAIEERNDAIRSRAFAAILQKNPCTTATDKNIAELMLQGQTESQELRASDEVRSLPPHMADYVAASREAVYLKQVDILLIMRENQTSCDTGLKNNVPSNVFEEKYPALSKRLRESQAVNSLAPANTSVPSDVPTGSWFYTPVQNFAEAGYLENEPRFRPNDQATRAEFIKMLVEMNGGVLTVPPESASFVDVEAFSSYYGYFEDAAKEGWVTGEGQCYGLSKPCYARPFNPINRAEAAALIIRSFGLQAVESAPSFSDATVGQWYADGIRIAAGHCILRGDANANTVRPADYMTRAEMVTMLYRVDNVKNDYSVKAQNGSSSFSKHAKSKRSNI